MPKPRLAVGGLVPFTTIDFPGRLAAVVFCQGCPWRCGYCHNPHLLPPGPGDRLWAQVRDWLASRQGLLDGVVFSGGEPLLQAGLAAALADVRGMGFATALHTGGAYPRRLSEVLPLLDWVGFDVKAPFGDYAGIVGSDAGARACQSLQRLMDAGTTFEVRCTVAPQLDAVAIARLRAELAALGIHRLVLQICRDAEGRCVSDPSALATGATAGAIAVR